MRLVGCCLVLVGSLVSACGDEADDGGAPDTILESQPPALTNAQVSTFFFRTNALNATGFLCSIDGGSPAACTPPVDLELPDGEHTFSVAATTNSQVDETPATATWRIDTTPPETTLLAAPPAIDNDADPEFSFEGTDTASTVAFECALDSATPAPCTSPFTVPVPDGNHTFTIIAVDAAGNRDATPVVHSWLVTTVAPDTQLTAGPSAGAVTADAVTFEFTSPDTLATFECALDGAAFAACTSPLAFTGLADGAHTFAVRAVATAGADPSPAMVAWTVDAVAPPVAITGTPANPSNDTTPAFTFSSTDATATFECQIDGVVTFTACTSPFESPALADGSRTFRVRATDPVGNVGAPATFAWVVDTVAPTVTITAQPAALSNDATPAVTFTTAGNPATTTCRVDAGAPVACTSPFTFGATADGTHTITVTVTDAAGNAGSATTAPFEIDTVAPTVAITTQPAALSNNNDPSVTFTVAGAPTVIQCRLDAGTFVACTSPFTLANVADGNHTITIRVADGAGNASTATTAAFTIDTLAPTVNITAQPAALSNNNDPSVTFTVAGAPTTITCQLDAGAPVACTSPFAFTDVADGNHTITVRVADGAGNASTDVTSQFTIDTVAPTVAITAEPAALSNNNDPSVTFTVAGAPTVTQCRLDAGAFAACTSPFALTNVADGNHTITIRVADGAGNASTATTAPFTIDTVAPTVAITGQPAALSNDNTPSVTFNAGGSPTTITCQLDAGTPVACTSPFTFGATADGTHTITVRVADGAGNAASATTSPFTIDTVAPTVAITAQPSALSNDTTPTVAFTTTGGPTSTTCQLDAGTPVACTSPFTFGATADGTHTITVRVADGAGNAASATTAPFTIDTAPPTIAIASQPAPISNNNDPSVTFTVGGNPTSTTCQLDTTAPVACTSPFALTNVADGNHTITIRATDGAGNAASVTVGPFTIDTVAPTVTITQSPLPLSNDTTPTVNFTTAGNPTTTQCRLDAGAFVACAPPSFTTTAGAGAHTITIQVIDAAGNSSTATTPTFTIDVTAPIVTFTDAPPTTWPVNYYDMRFQANETSTLECSLNNAAFTTCTSPLPVTTAYNQSSSFRVRARDTAGNTSAPVQTTWTSVDGLVLHYPWEQGGTTNTSLLAQRPAFSPDGDVATLAKVVGGWAGTAIGPSIEPHKYPGIRRPLTSAALQGFGTVSFWIRSTDAGQAVTLFSNAGPTGGLEVALSNGSSLIVTVINTNGSRSTTSNIIAEDRWVHIALVATGPAKGLQIFEDGNFVASLSAPTGTGFDPGMADALTVGTVAGPLDLDDLRFFNRALTNDEICLDVARGFRNGNGACVPGSPGFEFDFEGGSLKETGFWNLPHSFFQGATFVSGTTGDAVRFGTFFPWGITEGFTANVNSYPVHSFSFWFEANTALGNLIDMRGQCAAGGPPDNCGVQVRYVEQGKILVFAGTDAGVQQQVIVDVPFGRRNNVTITEQKNEPKTTVSLTIYVNGKEMTRMDIGAGNVFEDVANQVELNDAAGSIVDEYEIWPTDLSKSEEALCENGFDGTFDPATNTCLLTAN